MVIFITGSQGTLGRAVVKAAARRGIDYVALPHANLDITCKTAVRAALKAHHPWVVINCAGLTPHHACVPLAEDYRRANTSGPIILANEAARVGARVIHVSTDCVFSGARDQDRGPHTEYDAPDPADLYGLTKWQGELGAPHLTVRTSFVSKGSGFLAWLAAPGTEAVPLWTRALWSGTTAPALARALLDLAHRPTVTGLAHLASDLTTKAQLAYLAWELGIVRPRPFYETPEPTVNRWLATVRDDLPALPPLRKALGELRR